LIRNYVRLRFNFYPLPEAEPRVTVFDWLKIPMLYFDWSIMARAGRFPAFDWSIMARAGRFPAFDWSIMARAGRFPAFDWSKMPM